MTAAGEWLPNWLRAVCGADESPAGYVCSGPAGHPGDHVAQRIDGGEYARWADGAGAPPPAPAPSLVSGAIGRSMADAREAYRQQLADEWHALGGPSVHACTDAGLGPEGQEGRSPL